MMEQFEKAPAHQTSTIPNVHTAAWEDALIMRAPGAFWEDAGEIEEAIREEVGVVCNPNSAWIEDALPPEFWEAD